jgi:hypothetical protein
MLSPSYVAGPAMGCTLAARLRSGASRFGSARSTERLTRHAATKLPKRPPTPTRRPVGVWCYALPQMRPFPMRAFPNTHQHHFIIPLANQISANAYLVYTCRRHPIRPSHHHPTRPMHSPGDLNLHWKYIHKLAIIILLSKPWPVMNLFFVYMREHSTLPAAQWREAGHLVSLSPYRRPHAAGLASLQSSGDRSGRPLPLPPQAECRVRALASCLMAPWIVSAARQPMTAALSLPSACILASQVSEKCTKAATNSERQGK